MGHNSSPAQPLTGMLCMAGAAQPCQPSPALSACLIRHTSSRTSEHKRLAAVVTRQAGRSRGARLVRERPRAGLGR